MKGLETPGEGQVSRIRLVHGRIIKKKLDTAWKFEKSNQFFSEVRTQ